MTNFDYVQDFKLTTTRIVGRSSLSILTNPILNTRKVNRSPVSLFEKFDIQYQNRRWRNLKTFERKRRIRVCPWHAFRGRRKNSTHLLPNYNSLRDQPLCFTTSTRNTISLTPSKNQNLPPMQNNISTQQYSEYSSLPLGSQNCKTFSPRTLNTLLFTEIPSTVVGPMKETCKQRIMPQQNNRVFPRQVQPKQQYQSQEVLRGVRKRYPIFTHKRVLQLRKELNISKVFPKSPCGNLELPHEEFVKRGNRALALKTALTYFALGEYYNAPKPSELPKPPEHWINTATKVDD